MSKLSAIWLRLEEIAREKYGKEFDNLTYEQQQEVGLSIENDINQVAYELHKEEEVI